MEESVAKRGWKRGLREWAKYGLSLSTRRTISRLSQWPPVGLVRWGQLRRVQPIDRDWGLSRGLPIDRYYIQQFLQAHRADIHGHVLEIGDDSYTRFYGGDRVIQSDVLHVAEHNPGVTIIGDLSDGTNIVTDTFDCIILTQTLQTIYSLPAAINTIYRILKPDGVALITVPGISKVSRYDMDRWGYFWSFTSKSAQRLFAECFASENVVVQVYGNVLASIAFLHGLATSELKTTELDFFDPDYELIIGVRAVKRVDE